MDAGRIVALVIALTTVSALFAFTLTAVLIGVSQWWDDLTRHQPKD